jgi:hypothetical protein
MSRLTTDPEDPDLTHGVDAQPVPQAAAYLVMNDEEKAKGYVRPVRTTYRHDRGLACGVVTTMSLPLAETYAARPDFYGATYCAGCKMHLPVAEFDWDVDGTRVGS